MTIPKRDKRKKRGRPKGSLKAPLGPPKDKMMRAYTHRCPYCGEKTFSTMCPSCGRVTVINK